MICYLIVVLPHAVPPPTAVTVTASPDGPFIVEGHPLSLTGTIKLSESLNIAVTVNTVWSGPPGTQFTTTTSVATRMTATTYTSTATISSVETSDSGEYTCTATVSSTSPFLTDSENMQGPISIAVGMLQLCFKYSPLSVCSSFASFVSFPFPIASLSASITSSGNNTDGELYQLTCTSTLDGYTGALIPSFQWTGPPDDMVITVGSGGDTRMVLPEDTSFSSVLQFNPLRVTHEGSYTCEVVVGHARETSNVMVLVNGEYD